MASIASDRATAARLFDEDFLRKLEYFKLVSKQLLPGLMKGEHRSKQRGSGIEFADYRPYVAGDDVRQLDWGAYLRFDKLLLRLFEEEGDLPIYIFLDASRSMVAGDPKKFDVARRFAAALAYVGLLNLDRVHLVAYADGIVSASPTLHSPNQVFRAFDFMARLEPGGPTDLAKALETFFRTTRRRGLTVLLSDFFDPRGLAPLDRLTALRHDLLAIQLTSTLDEPTDGSTELMIVDSETGTKRRVPVTPDLASAYRRVAQEHAEELRSYCRKRGWDCIQASVEADLEDLILGVFQRGRFLR